MCSWQAVINTTAGCSKLKENQFISKTAPDTSNLTFNFKFADVPSDIVLFPGSKDSVWLSQDRVLITTKGKPVNTFKLFDDTASSPLYCINPNDLYVDTLNQIVYISCSTAVLALSVQNGVYYMETIGEGSAHAFVLHDGYTNSIYIDDSNALLRFNLKNGDVQIYSDVMTSLTHCPSKWQPLTFNTTYFILKCKETKHIYLVKEDGQDKHLIPLNGELWNLNNIVVDLTASNFTFYKNGFQSKCSVSLPFPVSRVYSIDIDGNIILVLLTSSVIMTYNTSKGCNDQHLQVIANGTFPCFSGGCDGYHLFGGQYILVVSLHSGTYRVEVIDLKSMSPTDYHFNLFYAPQGLNVFCDPAPTSLPRESGSGYVHSIDNSTNQTSTQLPVPSPTSININTTAPFSVSTSVISSPFSVGSSVILSIMPSTRESPTAINKSFPLYISLPSSLGGFVVLLLVVVIVCSCVIASWKCSRKQTQLSVEEKTVVSVPLDKLNGKNESGYSSLADDSYYIESLPQNDPHNLIVVSGTLEPRLNNTDLSTYLSTNADQVQQAV